MSRYRIFRERFQLPPCFCIGPRSFQADRAVPATDTIILPSREFPEYERLFYVSEGITHSELLGHKSKLVTSILTRGEETIEDRTALDFRFHTPQNFAHFLGTHIPLLVAVAQQLDIGIQEIKVILPAEVPEYINGLAECFGLDVLQTDRPVEGRIVTFTSPHKSEFRHLRRELVAQAGLPDVAAQYAATSNSTFGGKYFVARRGTRALENNDEVTAHLAAHGYETVYLEELPLPDQFKLMQSATSVIAIHGAGLASLFYAKTPGHLQEIIELQPVGLASTIFREMAQALGVYYITVRGRLKPAYIPGIYKTTGSFMAFQNDTFSLDLDALDQALAFAKYRINVPPGLPI